MADLIKVTKGSQAGIKRVPIMAGSFVIPTDETTDMGVIDTATSGMSYVALIFDPDTQETACVNTELPSNYTGGTIKYCYDHIPGGAGSVIYGVKAKVLGDNTDPDTAYGSAVEVSDATQTANYLHRSATSAALTPSGTLAGSKFLSIQLYRKAADAGDTVATDDYFVGLYVMIPISSGV